MTPLQAYLNSPRARRALSKKPGEEGFSLIELVVVVAVLAVLSAIAIPSFTNISGKARATAAANTLATIAKECAAKIADTGVGANATFVVPALDGYRTATRAGFFIGLNEATAGTTPQCTNSEVISFKSDSTAQYPDFAYNTETGVKSCTADAGTAAANRGCSSGVW
jgi:type IV pilus assembly protein PilA